MATDSLIGHAVGAISQPLPGDSPIGWAAGTIGQPLPADSAIGWAAGVITEPDDTGIRIWTGSAYTTGSTRVWDGSGWH